MFAWNFLNLQIFGDDAIKSKMTSSYTILFGVLAKKLVFLPLKLKQT